MSAADHAGVIAPPPLLYLAGFGIMLGLDALWPLSLGGHPGVSAIGIVLIVTGTAWNLWGAIAMLRARTPINPYRPVDRIVSNGPFRFSRNPLYVGLDMIFPGLALVLDSAWGLVLFAGLLVIMHFGVIRREERYLRARFGPEYIEYCKRVRRYL